MSHQLDTLCLSLFVGYNRSHLIFISERPTTSDFVAIMTSRSNPYFGSFVFFGKPFMLTVMILSDSFVSFESMLSPQVSNSVDRSLFASSSYELPSAQRLAGGARG